jgi:tRNA dimethylallyltransferase
MLYVDAVCKGIDFLPDTDPGLRQLLKHRLETEGLESLRLQLKKLDPDYYGTVDLKNPNRIIHALEICLQTGKPFSSFRTNPEKIRPFSIIKIGLNTERKILHERINQRVDRMIDQGLEKEARGVFNYCHLNALNTVGYREWFAYFNGDYSREKAIELIKRNTRRYARKQITWFSRDSEIVWFEPNQTKKIIEHIENRIY